jgi:hypothetical protein
MDADASSSHDLEMQSNTSFDGGAGGGQFSSASLNVDVTSLQYTSEEMVGKQKPVGNSDAD